MRISDWSSDVCSSDLARRHLPHLGCRWPAHQQDRFGGASDPRPDRHRGRLPERPLAAQEPRPGLVHAARPPLRARIAEARGGGPGRGRLEDRYRLGSPRSEEHTSELQSLMRISYAVFCLKKKKIIIKQKNTTTQTHTTHKTS